MNNGCRLCGTSFVSQHACLFVCLGTQVGDDPCAVSGDPTMLKPSFGAQRLEELVSKLLANSTFRQQQCVF